MMRQKIEDELADIERSAKCGDSFTKKAQAGTRPSQLSQEKSGGNSTKSGNLLVDFPHNFPHSGDDSDGVIISGSTRPNTAASKASTSSKTIGEAERMEQLLANSEDLPGGPNHRPLVGGFAAAAYEAAKEHHYSQRRVTGNQGSGRRPPPPSI